jgi:hypothetical protein
MQQAMQQDGSGLNFFGGHLEIEDPEMVGATLQRFRDTLTEHLQKQRSCVDSATWDIFALRSRAVVGGFTVADDELLKVLAMNIDGI